MRNLESGVVGCDRGHRALQCGKEDPGALGLTPCLE